MFIYDRNDRRRDVHYGSFAGSPCHIGAFSLFWRRLILGGLFLLLLLLLILSHFPQEDLSESSLTSY